MGSDTIHLAGIKNQAAVVLSRLPTAGEDCNPIDDALPVMPISSTLKDEGKGRIKRGDVTDDCNNSGVTATSPGLPSVCPITTPRAETTKQTS